MRDAIARCLAGEVSPPLGMMQALLVAGNLDRVKVVVELVSARLSSRDEPQAVRRCREMARALPRNARVRAGLRAVVRESGDYFSKERTQEEAIAACRTFFDKVVAHSEEASVALYSLGDPSMLARATAEVIDWMNARKLLGPEREILQIGCGTGRFEAALSGSVRRAVGIDVSSGMIAAARRHCMELPNVELFETSGEDLSRFDDASFDLVYAVDTFPYLVMASEAVVEAHFRDAARVLRPGGDFVLLNYSYRNDPARDAEEVAGRARAAGLDIALNGETPFALWDGVAFHLRRPPAHT